MWAVVRRLPQMQRVVVNRFRKRNDAESYLQALRRYTPEGDFVIVFDPIAEDANLMPRKEYNKLVRDRIPEILDDQKIQFSIEKMETADYRQALRCKLVEEAQEAAKADDGDLIAELADLCEVIDAMLVAYDIQRTSVLACQMQRRSDRGSFTKKLRLLWTEV